LGEGIDAAEENGSDRMRRGEIMMKDSSLAQIGSPLRKATRLPFEGYCAKKRGKIDTGMTPCLYGIFIGFKIWIKGRINPVHMQIIISSNTASILDTTCKNFFLYMIAGSTRGLSRI